MLCSPPILDKIRCKSSLMIHCGNRSFLEVT
jgi:hypothetical protein